MGRKSGRENLNYYFIRPKLNVIRLNSIELTSSVATQPKEAKIDNVQIQMHFLHYQPHEKKGYNTDTYKLYIHRHLAD